MYFKGIRVNNRDNQAQLEIFPGYGRLQERPSTSFFLPFASSSIAPKQATAKKVLDVDIVTS